MKRIYLAGAYSSNHVLGVLDNIHDGIKQAAKILKDGDAVFCPWLDHQYHFFDKTLTVEEYQKNSMAWLEVADEVWVLPNYQNSSGTRKEINQALMLNIPVVFLESE